MGELRRRAGVTMSISTTSARWVAYTIRGVDRMKEMKLAKSRRAGEWGSGHYLD
jgi:hypothetical protein